MHTPAGLPPVTLSAAKATLGHTETAAGAIGIFRATNRLQHAAHPEMLHLRSLNPYVTSSLDAAKADARKALAAGSGTQHAGGFSAARQMAAAPADDVSGANGRTESLHGAIGISAFAFQGTNAHVLVAAAAASVSVQAEQKADNAAVWQRRCYWYAPEPSVLLAAVSVMAGSGSGTGLAIFALQLEAPSLAYLQDHQAFDMKCFLPLQGCLIFNHLWRLA